MNAKANGVQKQLRWLLLVLVVISAVNAFVFWNTLHNLIASFHSSTQTQKTMASENHHPSKARKNLSRQERMQRPDQTSEDAASSALEGFLGVYLVIFFVTVIVLGQFMKRRIFYPIRQLSEKMKNFQAGHYELPPPAQNDDEISDLESQFYNMAGRVGDTVKDLKEIDKAKTDFISIASHELRTPMTAVKGSLSLILSGDLYKIDPDLKEILVIAEKETDRLIRLINDILDLTKMETKQLPLDKKYTDLGLVVKEAIDGVNGLLEVTKVSAKIMDPGYQVNVFIDRDRIQQVITNLLSNAIKFSPSGSTVIISFEAHPNENGKGAIVRIKDSGVGIKPEDHSHMFEKFRSTDSGRSKVIKGTGLGLPICKALIEQHGGQIGVQSILGEGSTFYFIIPEPSANSESKEDLAMGEAA